MLALPQDTGPSQVLAWVLGLNPPWTESWSRNQSDHHRSKLQVLRNVCTLLQLPLGSLDVRETENWQTCINVGASG